ncbi:MAG: hypothetical protein FWE11_04230 [Defluviitaleaceae bacterium]|nr:hypothetical protein [Defluviitaleaceae bacterium]
MKKIITIALLLVLALGLLAACRPAGEGSGEDTAEASPAPGYDEQDEDEIPQGETWQGGPTRGVWVDNMYINEYLNLRLVVPHEWIVANDEEVAALSGLGAELLTEVDESFWEAAGALTLIDMLVTDPFTGISVQVAYERLVFPMTRFNETDYIQRAVSDLGVAGVRANAIPGTTTIGDYDWHLLRSYLDMAGGTVIGNNFITIRDGFVTTVSVIHGDLHEPLDEILPWFSSLNDPPPPPLPTPTPPPPPEPVDIALVGAWAWEFDESYIYEFRLDGTGRRGFYPSLDDFEWQTVAADSHLILHFGIFQESWSYTIIGDVVTLDSRQDIGLSYSYVRWEGDFVESELGEFEVDFTGHPLIGTWVWDEDSSFIYIFLPDGTGTRGFAGQRSEIFWFAEDDYLLMDTGGTDIEFWIFSISDDVLNLENLYDATANWNYVRQ